MESKLNMSKFDFINKYGDVKVTFHGYFSGYCSFQGNTTNDEFLIADVRMTKPLDDLEFCMDPIKIKDLRPDRGWSFKDKRLMACFGN